MEWVDRQSEPMSKLALLNSRLIRLRGAVKSGEKSSQVLKAAEKVRLAILSVIKAKLALVKEYPERDPQGRELQNLRDQDAIWRKLTVQEIVEQFGKPDA